MGLFTFRCAAAVVARSVARQHQHANFEVFDYPGHYLQKGDGEQYASVRIGASTATMVTVPFVI